MNKPSSIKIVLCLCLLLFASRLSYGQDIAGHINTNKAPLVLLSSDNLLFFDDFNYSSADSIEKPGDLFAINYWKINSNDSQEVRIWSRFNWDSHPLPRYFSIEDGSRLRIRLWPSSDRDPVIMTRLVFPLHGTFHARVRFSDLPPSQYNVMQAFWLKAPDDYLFFSPVNTDTVYRSSEIDFEWNNWFQGNNKMMHVTAISKYNDYEIGKITEPMHCVLYDNETKSSYVFPSCQGEYDSIALVPNQWYNLMIVIDSSSHSMQFSMISDGWNEKQVSVWAGDSIWGVPLTLNQHFPTRRMALYLSQHDKQNATYDTLDMDVEWIYVSSKTDLTDQDITAHIKQLRNEKTRRYIASSLIDTTDFILDTDITDKIIGDATTSISGPTLLSYNSRSTWILNIPIADTRYNMSYYVERRKYLPGKTNYVEVKKSYLFDHIYTEFNNQDGCYTELYFHAEVTDRYQRIAPSTTNFSATLLGSNSESVDCDLHFPRGAPYTADKMNATNQEELALQVFPNPTSGIITISPRFDIVDIFDLYGRNLISLDNSYTLENIDLSAFGLTAGPYLARIRIKSKIYYRMIIKQSHIYLYISRFSNVFAIHHRV